MRRVKTLKSIVVYAVAMLAMNCHVVAQEAKTAPAEKEETSPFLDENSEKKFIPIVSIESWATYSTDEEVKGASYEDRGDVSFRRFRFGAKGAPYSWMKYSFQLHLDRLGEDNFAATKGKYGGLGVWNAFITAKLLKKSDLLNIHAGYFWAAISREFNTSPWAVSSFDKTRANWYMRNFITGTGNGIESGIALGGMKNFDGFGIGYRVGTYEPLAYASAKYASRLYTGRLMLSVGDPEQKKYGYMLCGNQWGKRNGVTVGVGASSQSDGVLTDSTFFDNSTAYGADLAVDLKGVRLEGEYFKFNRTADGSDDFDGTEYHVRASYNFILAGKYIEPAVMYEKYEGEGAKGLYKYIGDDTTIDFGVNWYANKDKLKLALHYIIQDGSTSPNIGDYVGLSCQFKL